MAKRCKKCGRKVRRHKFRGYKRCKSHCWLDPHPEFVGKPPISDAAFWTRIREARA